MKKLPIHPYALLLPPMTPAEYAALKDSIATIGQTDAVITLDGKILDGRHRQDVLDELGKLAEIKTVEFKPSWGSPIEYVYAKAVHRNLTDSQKAAAAVGIGDELAKETAARSLANLKKGRERNSAPSAPANGKSAERAASLFGVSPRYVEEARLVRKQDPSLFDQVLRGEKSLPQARRAVHREVKRQVFRKAVAALPAGQDVSAYFHQEVGDALKILPTKARQWARLIVADPPYNIGIDYGDGEKADRLPREDYLRWCGTWMKECAEQLKPDGSLWVIINDEWAAEYVVVLKGLGLHHRGWIKWYETFGVNCQNNFNRTSRHLLYFTRSATRYVFNREAVNRPSDRQTEYGDARANPLGKIWDDVWGVKPKIPRLVDNSPERVPGFPTQLPLGLIKPIVGCCTDPGDWVLDLFAGSHTTSAACAELWRPVVAIEGKKNYAAQGRDRVLAALASRRRPSWRK